MRPDREIRRTIAQFLNGLAVAIIATLVLAPLAAETLRSHEAAVAIGVAVIIHMIAVRLAP